MLILGVDPGSKGAVAWSHGESASMGLISIANHDLVQLFLRFQSISHLAPSEEPRIAFIEQNTGYLAGVPRTGASMYKFGLSTGRIEMALAALAFDLRRVQPKTWQKAIGAPPKRSGESPSSWKGRLTTFARETCPELAGRLTRQNSDSVLILKYGLGVSLQRADNIT